MKRLFLSFLLLCTTALLFAQKVINDPNVEARRIGSFSGISVSGGIDLYLSYGDEAIAVSAARPELRDRIKTQIENGVLKIWFDYKSGVNISWSGDRKLKAYVSYKIINNLSASGGSDVLAEEIVKSNELKIHLSGGSDFKGKVDVENLRVDQSGGSDVHIAGKATTLSVEASGGSDFNGYDLLTEICSLDASGGSDIEVTANKELSAKAHGASDIHYKGQPNVKEARASGASSVKAKS